MQKRNSFSTFFVLIVLIFGFQNCADFLGGGIEFATSKDILNSPNCAIFDDNGSDYNSCANENAGLLGMLYYLEDRTDGQSRPALLYDKSGRSIPFNSNNLNSVNVIIDRGVLSDKYILMPTVSMPSVNFSVGFQLGENQYIVDRFGKKLVEAFALDLRGNLQLPDNKSAGLYELAVISDDGSLVDMDIDGDQKLENIINNDGYHSPYMKCSTKFFNLTARSSIPIRLRYYQGPRTAIALTLMMRRLPNNISNLAPGNTDALCNASVPNESYGDLYSRGWFIPNKSAYGLPSLQQL